MMDQGDSGLSHLRLGGLALLFLLAACGSDGADDAKGRGDGAPVQVGYLVIQPTSVPVEQSLPGRVAAFQIADVRPQVSGLIVRRMFTEGSIVRQGQTLYQIDPS